MVGPGHCILIYKQTKIAALVYLCIKLEKYLKLRNSLGPKGLLPRYSDMSFLIPLPQPYLLLSLLFKGLKSRRGTATSLLKWYIKLLRACSVRLLHLSLSYVNYQRASSFKYNTNPMDIHAYGMVLTSHRKSYQHDKGQNVDHTPMTGESCHGNFITDVVGYHPETSSCDFL